MKNIASCLRNIYFIYIFFIYERIFFNTSSLFLLLLKIKEFLLALSDALLSKEDLRVTQYSISLQLIASTEGAAALCYLSQSSISYRNGKGYT